jgi:hypothetical protein
MSHATLPAENLTTATGVTLQLLDRKRVQVRVRGTAPLITHKWSEKARRQMLDTQQKKAVTKEIRNPEADYDSATYWLDESAGLAGMPVVAFKAATIGAARYFDKKAVNMTMLRGALTFIGHGPDQLAPIYGPREMREDMVTVGISGTDLRYRPVFDPWESVLTIAFLPAVVTEQSVLALVDAGGMGGVGEWRPSKCATGSFGTYEVVGVETVE